jgi:predicted Zn-dependent protease
MSKFRRPSRLMSFAVLAFTVLFLACQTAPVSGRKRLILFPESEENSLGAQSYNDILDQSQLSTDRGAVNRIRTIGRNIAKVTEKSEEYNWEFNLIQDDEVVNAFCLPGGKVAVYTGILNLASSDAELATVMAHEIAHAIARHGGERMTQLLLVELGGMALQEALKNESKRTFELAQIAYGAGATLFYVLPYSRTHEYEADHLGLIYMATAGYDPHAAVDFWTKMNEKYGGQEPPEFLSTHPNSENRIKNLEKLLPEAMKFYSGD